MSTRPTAVEVDGVTKRFRLRHTHSLKESLVWAVQGKARHNDFCALDSVDLVVPQGQTMALLGRNGSGKSTLLKLMAGVMTPDEGRVRLRGRVAGLLEVGAGLHPDLTGRENVFLNASILGMDEAQIRARFDDIVDFADIGQFLDTQVRFYSSGMFLRLAFAVAVHTEPDVFLVDEILAVGDEQFRRRCLERIERLSAEGRTLVVVSHDLDLVERLCDRGVVLQQGKMIHDGDVAEAVRYLKAPA
ncbi:ABC transporter ATP-binding protein [Oryzihumus sp.]|jgi:ABC-2 type transport system ATP-binding protein|uniref:ABC transporter ATP-binding protein n=1 Tax=Oryzihumus sp. TaxID=1968903 RepID=UPI002ED83F01